MRRTKKTNSSAYSNYVYLAIIGVFFSTFSFAIELNETNLSAHVIAQSQALGALRSGTDQIKRSCITSRDNNQAQSAISELRNNIAKEFSDLSYIRLEEKNEAKALLELSKKLSSKSCNLFTTLLESPNSSTQCGKSQKVKLDAEFFFNSILELEKIDSSLKSTFMEISNLEINECMSKGMSENLFKKHKDFLNSIGGGKKRSLLKRIIEYKVDAEEALK